MASQIISLHLSRSIQNAPSYHLDGSIAPRIDYQKDKHYYYDNENRCWMKRDTKSSPYFMMDMQKPFLAVWNAYFRK